MSRSFFGESFLEGCLVRQDREGFKRHFRYPHMYSEVVDKKMREITFNLVPSGLRIILVGKFFVNEKGHTKYLCKLFSLDEYYLRDKFVKEWPSLYYYFGFLFKDIAIATCTLIWLSDISQRPDFTFNSSVLQERESSGIIDSLKRELYLLESLNQAW